MLPLSLSLSLSPSALSSYISHPCHPTFSLSTFLSPFPPSYSQLTIPILLISWALCLVVDQDSRCDSSYCRCHRVPSGGCHVTSYRCHKLEHLSMFPPAIFVLHPLSSQEVSTPVYTNTSLQACVKRLFIHAVMVVTRQLHTACTATSAHRLPQYFFPLCVKYQRLFTFFLHSINHIKGF